MGWMQFFYGLEFEDYFALHDDVGDVIADKLVVVIDLDLFLLFGVEASLLQLDQEGVLVDAFKEPKSEGVVDLVGAFDDFCCEVLVFHFLARIARMARFLVSLLLS